PRGAQGARVTDIRSVESLDEILARADPLAVTAWLARDDRAVDWQRKSRDHAQLSAFPGGVYRPRRYDGPVLSYVRWRIETSPWLPLARGNKGRPKDCVSVERTIEAL